MKILWIIAVMIMANQSFAQEFEGLPFGVNNFYYPFQVAQVKGISTTEKLDSALNTEKIPIFLDLGVANGRIHPEAFGSMAFGNIDSARDGADFDFSLQDVYVRNAQDNQIRLLLSLGPFVSKSPPEWTTTDSFIPDDTLAYRAYVRATVERYDGDGIDDMPGLLEPIKYWQLDNEADLHYIRRGSSSFQSPEEYVRVLQMSWEELKIADPDARLMINLAGLGQGIDLASEYLQDLIDLGALNYFDILSYHVYPSSYNFSDVRSFHSSITSMVGAKPIWITETAITSKSVDGFADSTIANETNQALWLVKNYVYHIANGVQNVMWLNYDDFAPAVNRMMKYGGLMTFSNHQKKLSYYTYKQMIEKLEGSDWDAVRTIQKVDNLYAYQFTKTETDELVYIAWWDWSDEPSYSEGDTKTVSIEVGYIDSIRITHAIPMAESGEDLNENDYPAFFTSKAEKVFSGMVTIDLGESPVFVEVLSPATSIDGKSAITPAFTLSQNHPNPFSQSTTINFGLQIPGYVELLILDGLGREIKILSNEYKAKGNYSITWDGRDDDNIIMDGGVYFYQIKINDFIRTKKLLFIN